MFIHCVYFWLKEDLTRDEVRQFEEGARALTTIESVRHGYLGTPASTDRPIIDRSYSYGLVIVCDGQTEHDAYQEDPVHDRFRETCSGFWKEVRIYDFVDGAAG